MIIMIFQEETASYSSASSWSTESAEQGKSSPFITYTNKSNKPSTIYADNPEQLSLDFDITANKDSKNSDENPISAQLKIRIENLIKFMWKNKSRIVNSTNQHEFVLMLFELFFSSNFESKPFFIFFNINNFLSSFF